MTAAETREKPAKLTAADLKKAIAERYEPPEWHCETEVTLAGRRLDVVAFNLWGARSYRIVGFEIKVARGDWLRELDQFQKSEEWAAVVDAFYVVTPPKLVRDDELPAGWGLLELAGSRMMTRRHAAVHPGIRDTLPRELVARFLDRMGKVARDAERSAAWRVEHELREKIATEMAANHKRETEAERAEALSTRRQLDELYRVLGVEPNGWRAHESALKAAGVFVRCERDANTIRQRLEMSHRALVEHARLVSDALSSLNRDASA